jgi:hypothetical protein
MLQQPFGIGGNAGVERQGGEADSGMNRDWICGKD